jgi:hypothetical protein
MEKKIYNIHQSNPQIEKKKITAYLFVSFIGPMPGINLTVPNMGTVNRLQKTNRAVFKDKKKCYSRLNVLIFTFRESLISVKNHESIKFDRSGMINPPKKVEMINLDYERLS